MDHGQMPNPPASRFATPLLAVIGLSVVLGACSARVDNLLSGTPSLATAQVALAGGSNDVALNICDGLLVKEPLNPKVLVCRGDALAGLGRGTEAMVSFQRALQIDSRSPGAMIGLGRVELQTDPARAEQVFLAALEIDPRDAVALNNLGIARDLQGRHADAQVAYGGAIAAAPGMRGAQVNLALSLAMSGKAGEAVRIMRPIAALPDASERERHDFAAVLAMDGKPDEAAQVLRTDLNATQSDEAIAGFRSLQAR
jgi:Flp pilus assembly protein TadD